MTLKQQLVPAAYIETHGNKVQTGKLVGYTGRDSTICTSVANTLKKPEIQSEINRMLEEIGSTEEVSLRALHQIIDGSDCRQTVQYGPDGKIRAKVVHPPRHSDTIKAIDLRAKLKGTYKQQEVAAEGALEAIRALRKQILGK